MLGLKLFCVFQIVGAVVLGVGIWALVDDDILQLLATWDVCVARRQHSTSYFLCFRSLVRWFWVSGSGQVLPRALVRCEALNILCVSDCWSGGSGGRYLGSGR